MPTIRIRDLQKSYGAVRALRGLDVEVPEGAVALLGPNGAGKSTLLKVLLGLLKPNSGSAEVLGLDSTREPLEIRRRVGYMPEVDAYLPGLTGTEAVRAAGVMCGMPARDARQRAHDILYYVGLGEARYRKVHEYSTGMRQRLRLAQALIHDPELIFLDEPTNGLDPAGRDEVLALIRDLVENHEKHVVFCSHLLHDVEAICDHVLVMREGELVLNGPMERVLALEEGMYRVRVQGDVEAWERELAARDVAIASRVRDVHQVRLPAGADARTLFQAALAAECSVRELSSFHHSLTGAFLQAVETD